MSYVKTMGFIYFMDPSTGELYWLPVGCFKKCSHTIPHTEVQGHSQPQHCGIWGQCPCEFATAAIRKYHNQCGLRKRNLLSQYWRLGIWDYGVDRSDSSWGLWGVLCPMLLPWILVVFLKIFGVHWIVDSSPWSLSSYPCGISLHVSVSVSKFPLFR